MTRNKKFTLREGDGRVSIKLFNKQVSDYLGRNTKNEWDVFLSTDKFLEDLENEDRAGFCERII